MIREVKYKEDGSIEIDNTELLNSRADISDEPGTSKLQESGLGGDNTEIEEKLREDKKRTQWTEPTHTENEVVHICPVCGTKFWGRTNRIYCSKQCQETGKKRDLRAKKRKMRDFKPHRGKAGEVYFISEYKNKETITFVPSLYAENREKAEKYIRENYADHKKLDDYVEQMKEAIKK